MVMDSFFILDFIYKLSKGDESMSNKNTQSILYDLLLLENQIPLFFLDDIFICTILEFEPITSLTNLILPILNMVNFLDGDLKIENVGVDASNDHILGLLHKSYQLVYDNVPRVSSIPKGHSAIELDRARVSFKPDVDAPWPVTMKLEMSPFAYYHWSWSKPTLKMPVMCMGQFH